MKKLLQCMRLVIIQLNLFLISFSPSRHGILGSVNRGTGACPDGARRRSRGDHHLLLSVAREENARPEVEEEQSQQQPTSRRVAE